MCLRSVAPLAHMHAHSRVHAMRPRSHTTIYAKHSKQLVTSDRRYCRLSLVLPVSRSNSTPPLLLFRRFNRFPLCRYSRRRCRRRLPLWWRCRRRRRRRRRSTYCRNARSPLALRVGHSRVESTPCRQRLLFPHARIGAAPTIPIPTQPPLPLFRRLAAHGCAIHRRLRSSRGGGRIR